MPVLRSNFFLSVLRLIIGGFWYFSVLFVLLMAVWLAMGLAGIQWSTAMNLEVPLQITFVAPHAGEGPAETRLLGHDGSRVEFRLADIGTTVRMMLLATTLCSMVVTWHLRGFLRDVHSGRPFGNSAPRRLRMMGIMIVVATLMQGLSLYVLARHAERLLREEGIVGTPRFTVAPEPIVLGLLVMLLGELFLLSARLQEDHDLTV